MRITNLEVGRRISPVISRFSIGNSFRHGETVIELRRERKRLERRRRRERVFESEDENVRNERAWEGFCIEKDKEGNWKLKHGFARDNEIFLCHVSDPRAFKLACVFFVRRTGSVLRVEELWSVHVRVIRVVFERNDCFGFWDFGNLRRWFAFDAPLQREIWRLRS